MVTVLSACTDGKSTTNTNPTDDNHIGTGSSNDIDDNSPAPTLIVTNCPAPQVDSGLGECVLPPKQTPDWLPPEENY